MTDQLQLVSEGQSIPPRPSETAVLRDICPACGKAPEVGETSLLFRRHTYPKWDAKNRRGRCAGSGTHAKNPKWVEPPR